MPTNSRSPWEKSKGKHRHGACRRREGPKVSLTTPITKEGAPCRTCVEFYFDGATPDMAKVWSDGTEVMFTDIAVTPTIQKAVQFTSFDIGIAFYHGTSLMTYDGNDPPFI